MIANLLPIDLINQVTQHINQKR